MSYKQILTTNDIGTGANQVAAGNHNHDSNYVKKSGDTMTGQLAINKAGYGFRINNGSTGYIELSRDGGGAQLYGLWDCIKQQWIVQSDGSNISFHGNADIATMVKDYNDNNTNIKIGFRGAGLAVNDIKYIAGFTTGDNDSELKIKDISKENLKSWLNYTPGDIGAAASNHNQAYTSSDCTTYTSDDATMGITPAAVKKAFTVFTATKATNATNTTNVNIANDTSSKLYVLGATTTGNTRIYRESSVYMSGNVLYGAAWNDYAEYRKATIKKPGKCIIEKGDDTLIQSTTRLQPGAAIISDTFGFAIGETEQAKTPIAVSGRVLAYPYESREEFKKNIGRPVCSGPNGTVSIMTDEEYRDKGYCAIGTISAVPDYEEWGTGKVKVNGRVWIKVF